MPENQDPSKKEILWRQYNLHTDLYKFYLKLGLKANIYYYGITGAIVTYYLMHKNNDYIRYSLLLPVILWFLLILIFVYGAIMMKYPRKEIFDIRDELELSSAPELQVLSIFLCFFSFALLIVSISITFMFFCKF